MAESDQTDTLQLSVPREVVERYTALKTSRPVCHVVTRLATHTRVNHFPWSSGKSGASDPITSQDSEALVWRPDVPREQHLKIFSFHVCMSTNKPKCRRTEWGLQCSELWFWKDPLSFVIPVWSSSPMSFQLKYFCRSLTCFSCTQRCF